MHDLEKAISFLPEHTCVLCRGEAIYASTKTGIAPMLEWIAEGTDLRGFSAADKIVGKAAALLFVLSGVKEVYGQVVSRSALTVLDHHHIPYRYTACVPYIINRKGDGMCPMEETVQNISDPQNAYKALVKKRNELAGHPTNAAGPADPCRP